MFSTTQPVLLLDTRPLVNRKPVDFEAIKRMRLDAPVPGIIDASVDGVPVPGVPQLLLEDMSWFWCAGVRDLWQLAIEHQPARMFDSGGARLEFWFSAARRLRVRVYAEPRPVEFEVAAEATLLGLVKEAQRVTTGVSRALGADTASDYIETLQILERRLRAHWSSAPDSSWTIGPEIIPSSLQSARPPLGEMQAIKGALREARSGGSRDRDSAMLAAAVRIAGLTPGEQLGAIEKLAATHVRSRLARLWLQLLSLGAPHHVITRTLVSLASAACDEEALADALCAGAASRLASAESRMESLGALCDLPPSRAAIAASTKALDDPWLASTAVLNLAHFGVTTAHPALHELLEACEPTVRRAARKVLGGVG